MSGFLTLYTGQIHHSCFSYHVYVTTACLFSPIDETLPNICHAILNCCQMFGCEMFVGTENDALPIFIPQEKLV